MKKVIVVAIVLVAFSVLLGTASAQGTSSIVAEIRARIADLLKQVADLQSQLKKLEAQEPERWCHTFSVDMGVGVGGEEVAALYRALQQDTGTLPPDADRAAIVSGGIFTEATAAIVSEFQLKYADEVLRPLGLPSPTGYAGKGTRAKLNQLYGCGDRKPAPQSSNIKIFSPAGGDRWIFGSKEIIRWQYNSVFLAKLKAGSFNSISIDIKEVGGVHGGSITRMDAVFGERGEGSVDTSRLINFTSYDWNVGSVGAPSGGFSQTLEADEVYRIIPDKKYQLSVCGGTSETFYATCDKSPAFSIVKEIVKSPVPAAAPKILKLTPPSGPVGTQVTVVGSGFSGPSMIQFGNGIVFGSNAKDGTSLTFFVPLALVSKCFYDPKPCEMVSPATTPGTYPVVVTNERGTSNKVLFAVTEGSVQPIPSPSTINIFVPAGGEQWKEGQSYLIRWTVPAGMQNEQAKLMFTDAICYDVGQVNDEYRGCGAYTVGTVPVKQGYYNWAIPRGMKAKTYGVMSDVPMDDANAHTWKGILLMDFGGKRVTSKEFTIVGNDFTVPYISGVKSAYAPGEAIVITLRGVEYDGSPASPEGGFAVWASINNSDPSRRNIQGTYDANSKSWRVTLTAPHIPPSALGSYQLSVLLRCSNEDLCLAKYASPIGRSRSFNFNLSASY